MLSQNIYSQTQECDQTPVQLILNSGDWAEEISWSVYTSNGVFVDSSSVNYLNNIEYIEGLCLDASLCYQLNLFDSYGDGWNGAHYILQYQSTSIIANGTLAPSTSYDSTIFCVSDVVNCEANLIQVDFETGDWSEEVSWSITNTTTNLTDSISIGYLDSTAYSFQFCLEDACYLFNMYDTYGDGWQGASFQLNNEFENVLASGELDGGYFGQIVFTLNSECNIDVCQDELATNYNVISSDGSECIYISQNISLLSNWFDPDLELNGIGGSYTDVYGYSNGVYEYAIIGSTFGLHIIDVSNPTEPVEVTRIEGAESGSIVTHRDFHTLGKYLYAVCDQGESTLQIIDLSNLPLSVEVVYDSAELFTRSHNIFIDTLTSKMYSCSTKGYDMDNNYWTSSLCVYDISNPLQPYLLHNMDEYIPNTHDIWVDNDTAFINCPSTGTLVWEFENSPSQISSFTSYPDFGTNHSGWKSGDTYVFAEENSGYDLKIVDASNLEDLELVSTFNTNVNEFSIAHNLMIKDNLVYISYYHDGLQVYDISNPTEPIQVAFYDTYLPENTGGYAGAWGVYSFLPSGNILISDVQSGLFVLEMNLSEEQRIPIYDGWNMVSTYLRNEDLDASLFIGPNSSNVVIMKNSIGMAYLPDWGFDGIGLLEYGQGYQMKVNSLDTLSVVGVYSSVLNSIELNEGWNMISVLSKSEMDLEFIIANLIDEVIIVKDNTGSVYLPEWDFNSIGNVVPGQGYQLKMSNSGILTY